MPRGAGVSNAFRLLGSGGPRSARRNSQDQVRSQMPFGFWVLGDSSLCAEGFSGASKVSNAFRLLGSGGPRLLPTIQEPNSQSQMPFGFWVLGDRSGSIGHTFPKASLKCLSAFGFWGTLYVFLKVIVNVSRSQMPFGFWVLGDSNPPALQRLLHCLKCLSAFGFWGTYQAKPSTKKRHGVSNAFRLLGSGGHRIHAQQSTIEKTSLKCLSAFGFWGTLVLSKKADVMPTPSQMPFGFWVLGDCEFVCLNSAGRGASQMPFGFWVLGDDEIQALMELAHKLSQMPFGFWVLGDLRKRLRIQSKAIWVSNAFRLLGSGGHPLCKAFCMNREEISFEGSGRKGWHGSCYNLVGLRRDLFKIFVISALNFWRQWRCLRGIGLPEW